MDKKIENFKKIVLKAMNLGNTEQVEMFNLIPDHIHESVFENNFNSNYQLARNIILNNFDQDSYKKIEKEKLKINDLTKSVRHISKSVVSGGTILFLTDTDNDGSLAQANILEFEKSLPEELKPRFETLYCQQINGNSARGFTVDLLDAWVEKNPVKFKSPLTIVTADNGINSRDEQEKIMKKYPNVDIIVTDHHNPDEDNVVLPNKKTMIVNPKYKPTKYFQEKNISGANVLGVLLEKTLDVLESDHDVTLKDKSDIVLTMREISRIANLLDYVDTDISDKPLKSHLIEKYSSLGALMNVNNSLNKIITTKLTNEEIKDIFNDVENVDIDEVISIINKMKEQNRLAEKILILQSRYNSLPEEKQKAIPKDRIFKDIILELEKPDFQGISDGINNNFVEQLRPFIYNYAASSSLNDYQSGILESMKNVYNTLKSEERKIQNAFSSADLMQVEKLDNATTMYPKSNDYLKLLNRKLLGKIYNEENNGLLMILDNIEKEKATGSFRSVYRIQQILENKETIEKMFDIKISFQGHDKAAGFFIESLLDKDLNTRVIADVNKFISNNIEILKQKDKKNYSHLIQTDFHFPAIDLFDKYNKAVKGSLTNMQSISPVIQFNKSTYVTESKTQQDLSLQQLIDKKKYGYIPVEISFDGKTIILPTEMLRQLSKNNFKDGIQVSFMNDGVFIGNKVIPTVNSQKLTKIKSPTSAREEIQSFFEKHYIENDYFVELPIEYLKESPFFKYNVYGEREFKRYESTVIDVIERSGVDKLVVADTEANGLGNAPKVINFGVVEISINPDSGSKIRNNLFKQAAYKSMTGKKLLLSKTQISNLKSLTKDDYKKLSFDEKQNILINLDNENAYFYSKDISNYKPLYNYKTEGNTTYVNREIKAEIGSIFIKNNDVKISERIKTLTAIDNTLLNKIGISAKDADDVLSKRYKDQKCIFQAHNLPYDLGVIKGNFKNFYKIVTDFESGNLLNDSAIYSREQKLAYDPIGIAVFEKDFVPALNGIQFFHSESSELSVKNFLSNEENGTLPDRTGRHVLKKKDGKLSIIDTFENLEVSVDVIHDYDEEDAVVNSDISQISSLLEQVRVVEMPKNAIKYSVQALSDYDIIRAMILSSSDFKVSSVPVPEVFGSLKEKLEYFMMNYHFDSSFTENMQRFSETLEKEEFSSLFYTDGFVEAEIERLKEEFKEQQAALPPRRRKRKEPDYASMVGEDPKVGIFKEFGSDFLQANESLQSKFHEVWAYKKVLTSINPTEKIIKDNDLIDLISYQTSLSEDKVKRIMRDAVDYKKKYDLDNVIQKEPHNNVFFDKCDVVMESVLTFKRPTDRSYNSFTHSVENVVDMCLRNIFRTTHQHKISQTRSMSIDSFSRKQALSYKRAGKTDYIEQSQKVDIENVKFKLGTETLPQDTFAYGVLKKELPEETLKELSDKLEFIVKNEQMRFSIEDKVYESEQQQEEMKAMLKVIKSNEDEVNKLKDELTEFFEYVYYSRKENDMKKCMQLAQESILFGNSIEPPKTMEKLRKREKNIIVDIVKESLVIANNLGISNIEEMTEDHLSITKGNALDAFLNSTVEEPALVADHPLINFFSSIPEISEEEFDEKIAMNIEQTVSDFDGDENVENISKRKAIVDVVKVKRRDDAKHLFKFKELLNNFLSNISSGVEMDFDYDTELKANAAKVDAKNQKAAKKRAPKK